MTESAKKEAANLRREKIALQKRLPAGIKLRRILHGHRGFVSSVAFDPEGKILASGGDDNTVKIWSLSSGENIKTLNFHERLVRSVVFHPSGKTLASGSVDGHVGLWDVRSGKLLHSMGEQEDHVWSVAYDPLGEMLATGGYANGVKIWSSSSGVLINHILPGQFHVFSVAFNPCGERIALGLSHASGSDDKTVKVFDASSGKLILEFHGHRDGVSSVAFDPSGKILVSGSRDNSIKIWEAETGKILRTLEGHTSNIDIVVFSPDGKILATKGSDRAIFLWNCTTWEVMAVIPGDRRSNENWTPALAFHPTLPLLASVGSMLGSLQSRDSESIHLWELDLDLLLGRPVTQAVTYTSAKVVLVGESNVGKSYLSHRLATGQAPEQGMVGSTHGMKFWPLDPRSEEQSSSVKPKLPSVFSEKLFGRRDGVDKSERRDIVLWDMGGQEEYRLIHQLFLHDTTVALMLFDPTRGATAFKEVEAWNKSLEKQLRGRAAVKILVGAKLDKASDMVDRQQLERLLQECGFVGYCETSALNGRGLEELCEMLAGAIDWNGLGKTSRPELFQAIRDEIENRREKGVVVMLFDDLDQDLQTNEKSETFFLMQHEVATASDSEAGTKALDAVCSQLAQQGTIARAKTSSGKDALIFRIEEVERYAGSLILAAKANQKDRGVPALELRAMAQEQFHFSQIMESERLPRTEEKAVVECTLQLMLEHGICFEHEGLLIFPSLFAPAAGVREEKLPHAVSLYYDFAGAIDNIYASLVAWLVLAKEFGKVRLWSERAEFEVKDGGLCGLRKVARPGGFAHVDVYFEESTSLKKKREFISFVEDHLATNGVEIKEQIVVRCPQSFIFDDETLRMRIAAGEKDVLCPRCDCRHSLTEGAVQSRQRDSKIVQHTWALRTEIAKRREKMSNQVVQILGEAEDVKPSSEPLRILHLSDLHFTRDTPVSARLQWLLDDLKQAGGLNIKELDYLVISGDFTEKGGIDGFERAYDFVSGLTQHFGLSAERCIFVPGNHDLMDLNEAYDWKHKIDGMNSEEWVRQGEIFLARNMEKYPLRLKVFSDSFFHKFLQRPYPLNYSEQGFAIPFWESGIQFLSFNSCWQIDQFYRKRSGIHVESVANAIKQAQKQEDEARKCGLLAVDKPLLRIAVWHHAVVGPEQMKDTDFLGNLQKNGVVLGLHGDVHEMRKDQVGYRHDRAVHIVGSGSFGARAEDRPESTTRLYNVLEIARDLKSVRVHTRSQPKADGPWDGWYEWKDPKGGDGRMAFYDIRFS